MIISLLSALITSALLSKILFMDFKRFVAMLMIWAGIIILVIWWACLFVLWVIDEVNYK